MPDTPWLAVLSRLTTHAPVDLDEDRPAAPAATGLPFGSAAPPDAPPVASGLWDRPETDQSFIGVRILQPVQNPASLALRLASAALERGVIPVILTALEQTGLEHFGFRIERLPAASDDLRAAYEAELARFWNLAIIIDVTEAAMLG